MQKERKYKAKKSLGQNFLKSELALKKIIEAGEIKRGDIILEIGPGRGALTEKLLEKVYLAGAGQGLVIAVEKDRELFEFLKTKFKKEIEQRSLVLVYGDILKFDAKKTVLKFFSGPRIPGSLPQPDHSKNSKSSDFKIIANIPYNITGAILKKFLGGLNQPTDMVLMVQQEVARRIMARDSKESILSISVKAYGEPKIVMKVPARYFRPVPKVDSAIIIIKNISRKIFSVLPPPPRKSNWTPPPYQGGGSKEVQGKTLNSHEFEEKFWEIVKAGFAHKRKKLSSNLKNLKDGSKASVSSLGDRRAEDLTLEDWIALCKKCYN